MKILVKIPSFGRPDKLKAALSAAIDRQEGDVDYIISLDRNDRTATNELIKELPGKVIIGHSNNKIDACNRDIPKKGWDILLLLSDDMICQKQGWDTIIKREMKGNYPDTDGCLWFKDGYQIRICTLPIMGHKYYRRFGYIYHNDYVSLWCDEEMTQVAQQLSKIAYSNEVLFKHEHPVNNIAVGRDALYSKNESYYYLDRATFERRKNKNYGL